MKKNQESNAYFLHFQTVFGVTPLVQILILSALFSIMVLVGFAQYKATGQMFGYPLAISLFFVPIYEEMIFRGFLLGELLRHFPVRQAFILECLLFSLWHLKNIFWLSPSQLLIQMLVAGLIFGPITTYITLKKKTIWPGVMLHYINNLLAGVNIIFLLTHFHL